MPDLLIALVIPAVLWGALIGLYAAAGRTWFDIFMVLVMIWIVLGVIGGVASGRDALIASVILHVFLAVAFVVSFTRFLLKEKRKGDRP